MLDQNIVIAKEQIAERRRRLTLEELNAENFAMIERIGEEVFGFHNVSWKFDKAWDTIERCYAFVEWQKHEISEKLIPLCMEEGMKHFERRVSSYDLIVLKDVIVNFYGVGDWEEDVLKEFDPGFLDNILNYFWYGLETQDYKKGEETSFDFNNGRERMKDFGKHKKNPRKDFKNNILIPIRSGEVQHHLTNNIIIGIPEEVHRQFSGYDRETHRKKVLEWLDEQAEKAKIAHAYLVLDEEKK